MADAKAARRAFYHAEVRPVPMHGIPIRVKDNRAIPPASKRRAGRKFCKQHAERRRRARRSWVSGGRATVLMGKL